ncbi:hypothetical protein V2J09_005143 [Rumex salicifolius]
MGLITLFISIFLIMVSYPEVQSSVDITRLIYRGCADQKFPDPSDTYIQNLKSLFQTLISESTKTNFSKTTVGDGQDSIFGLYQCRGDLTTLDCYNCVSQFPKLTKKLCGKTIAARFQLLGCYMRYEISGFKQISSTELLFKYCRQDSNFGIASGNMSSGFDQNRDLAFQQVEKEVVSNGGFYTTSYESQLFVLGQCEGDLGGEDCGDCIRVAFERVKAECGDSIEGQVYLHQCYVSYTYYPNGVQQGLQGSSSSGARHSNIQKTVAIVFGAAAGVGLIVVALLCTKSALKKKPQKHTTTYTYNM